MQAQLCQLEMVPQGEECYFTACDSSANHCPQLGYLSLHDAIWTFSKAIVFIEERNCLTACLSRWVLSIYFSIFAFFFFIQSDILLLKVGVLFLKKDLYLKVQMLFQPLSKNPTIPSCSWYCFVSSSYSLKISLLLCLHGRKCNFCKHCLKSGFLV